MEGILPNAVQLMNVTANANTLTTLASGILMLVMMVIVLKSLKKRL